MSVSLSFINGRKCKDKAKSSPIELRMTYERKTKYLSTGLNVLPSQFKNGQVKHHPNAAEYNDRLIALMSKAMQVVNDMERRGLIDLDSLPRLIKAASAGQTFWQYVEQMARLKNVKESTRDRYFNFLGQIKKWKKFETFSELTPNNLKEFDKFLHDQGYKPTTIGDYHKHLKMFCLDAECDGMIARTPYKLARLKFETAKGRIDKHLSLSEVRAIETIILEPRLARVRDMFVFCCYTGLAYADLCAFDKTKVRSLYEQKVLCGKRVKDGVDYIVPLLPQATALLDKYNWNLPVICNQKYNDYLKVVAMRAGLDKPISSHWARHTFGMLMLNHKVPIEIVSKVLGHSNITTTQKFYAQLETEAVVDAMKDYEQELAEK